MASALYNAIQNLGQSVVTTMTAKEIESAVMPVASNAGMISRELKNLGWTAKAARGQGVKAENKETVVKKQNPAEINNEISFISAALKKQLVGCRIMNPAIPPAWLETADGFAPNPEFSKWYKIQPEPIKSALQGNVSDADFDAGMFLLGIETDRRLASKNAAAAKEQQAIAQATALLVSSGHIVIKATDFQSALEYAASRLIHPTNEAIYESFSRMFMAIEVELPAFEGTGCYQYDGDGNLDSNASCVNLLTKDQRGCSHVLWYRLNLGEGTKLDKSEETKRAKALQAAVSVNLGASIHADWVAYHTPYQSALDALRTKQRKQAMLAAIIDENPDLDFEEVLFKLKAAQQAA